MKFAIVAGIFLVAAVNQVFAKCVFEPKSDLSEVDPDGLTLSCSNVYEVPDEIGESVCTFSVSGANSVTLAGELQHFNDIKLSQGNSQLDVIMINNYTDIIDTQVPDFHPSGTITCEDETGESSDFTLTINVWEENTQKPTFEYPVYIFTVYEGTDLDVDITEVKIYAEDKDNSEEGTSALSNTITFELERNFNMFKVISILEDENAYPKRYRASIRLTQSLPTNEDNYYETVITARNIDNNPTQTSTATIRIYLEDTDDMDPAFTNTDYIANITSNMLQIYGTHQVPTEPTIRAYDLDTGENKQIIYAINYDCDGNPVCYLVKYFRIDALNGELTFINERGFFPGDPNITFEISATQVNQVQKIDYANVTAYFDWYGTTVTTMGPTDHTSGVISDACRKEFQKLTFSIVTLVISLFFSIVP